MIFYDSTEARENSRLANSVIQAGKGIEGLEAATGADLLISPINDRELPRDVKRPPGKILLKGFVKGGFLIQRKSGGDFLNSIPRLDHILQRMKEWDEATSWLLVTGIGRDHKGKVLIEERDKNFVSTGRVTGWNWASAQGAKDAWQLRGGMLHEENNDGEAGEWILRWDKNMGKLSEISSHVVEPRVSLIEGIMSERPWTSTLATFPGIGQKRAMDIADYAKTLAWCLCWLSVPWDEGVAGIGGETKSAARRWLGLEENEVLTVLLREELQEWYKKRMNKES